VVSSVQKSAKAGLGKRAHVEGRRNIKSCCGKTGIFRRQVAHKWGREGKERQAAVNWGCSACEDTSSLLVMTGH
jgi:hypothetical protein